MIVKKTWWLMKWKWVRVWRMCSACNHQWCGRKEVLQLDISHQRQGPGTRWTSKLWEMEMLRGMSSLTSHNTNWQLQNNCRRVTKGGLKAPYTISRNLRNRMEWLREKACIEEFNIIANKDMDTHWHCKLKLHVSCALLNSPICLFILNP